jgi:hypothetical protein
MGENLKETDSRQHAQTSIPGRSKCPRNVGTFEPQKEASFIHLIQFAFDSFS